MNRWLITAALACALSSTSALAALNLQRTTTLTDSSGGTFSAVTSGAIEIPGANTTTQVTLTNFHPHDTQNVSANGSLTRARERGNDSVTNTYNGSVALSGSDKDGKPVNDSVQLQNVVVTRDGDGPQASGTIVVNGTSYDVAHPNEATKHVLHRVLRLFEFD